MNVFPLLTRVTNGFHFKAGLVYCRPAMVIVILQMQFRFKWLIVAIENRPMKEKENLVPFTTVVHFFYNFVASV